jgi:hypothetical protein
VCGDRLRTKWSQSRYTRHTEDSKPTSADVPLTDLGTRTVNSKAIVSSSRYPLEEISTSSSTRALRDDVMVERSYQVRIDGVGDDEQSHFDS